MHGETHGAEIAVKWKVSNWWTLSPGYAFLSMHLHPDPTSQDFRTAVGTEGGSPTHQAQLRSHVVLPGHLQFDLSGYFVGRLPAQSVASYTRLDAGVTWEPGERFSVSLVGQNLLQDHHLETTNPDLIVQSNLMKRSGYVKMAWHF
jgi:outer membrane receptor protein involved in Fe transport